MRTLLIAVTVSLGCSEPPAPGGDDNSVNNALRSRTIVHFNGAAPADVQTDMITATNQQRELSARQAFVAQQTSQAGVGENQEAIGQDTGCANSSLWLFDQASEAGNEICFYGSGTANLTSYIRACSPPPFVVCTKWSAAVRSFNAGAEYGFFYGNPYPESFTIYELEDTVDGIVSSAPSVTLSD